MLWLLVEVEILLVHFEVVLEIIEIAENRDHIPDAGNSTRWSFENLVKQGLSNEGFDKKFLHSKSFLRL